MAGLGRRGPAPGTTKPWNTRDADAVLEDIDFLIEHHVGLTEAARRLGFPSYDACEKWLQRRHEYPRIARLKANDPLPLNGPLPEHHLMRRAS